MRFVDCNGLGGFMSLGFVEQGMEMVHRTGTLDFGNVMTEANRHLLGDDWDSNFSDDPMSWHVPAGKIDAVIGLPPCSGWSCWTGPANRGPDAKAHSHTRAYMTYVGRVAPDISVLECVQQAYTQGREVMVKYREMVEEVSGEQYDMHHVKMNLLQVGGHAYRPRYFHVLVKAGMPFGTEVEWPDRVPTLIETIGDLADLNDTWEKQPYRGEMSRFVERQRSRNEVVDGHKLLDNLHGQRIKEIFDWLEPTGEDWKWGEGLSMALKRVYEHHGKLPPLWESKAEKIIAKDFDMGFSLPYRWAGNVWANVLTGGCLDMVVHPTRPRTITHREAARIQGLPDDWLIKPVRTYGPMRDAWGKAVSADAGRWVGHWARRALEGQPGAEAGTLIGEREWLHDTDKGFSRQKVRTRYFPGTKGGIVRAYNPSLWPWGRVEAQAPEICEVA
jgi:site-specific DNA-cytosine methylase